MLIGKSSKRIDDSTCKPEPSRPYHFYTQAHPLPPSMRRVVAGALLELAQHLSGEKEPERITIFRKIRQKTAPMAGVARENVSRTLTEWKRHGLIGQLSSYYYINHRDRSLFARQKTLPELITFPRRVRSRSNIDSKSRYMVD